MAAQAELLELRLRVPLPSAGVARLALGALGPDLRPLPPAPGEPRPHPRPRLWRRGGELLARWEAPGARGLRGGVGAFLELLGLVLETIERFGGGADAQPLPPHDAEPEEAPPPSP